MSSITRIVQVVLPIALPVITVIAFAVGREASWSVLQDPSLGCLLVPFAMYALGVRAAHRPVGAGATIYRMSGGVAVLALVLPVVTGQVHWGIVILPFALMRIVFMSADRLGTDEARAIARRTQLFGGLWIAGWAGVLP